ncbi:excinuclease ABC subunit UvrA [Phytomonospora endophytica]|uniref:UvrABC system protein A n=1 Tax=Phytomonospora endophytica TaxID=714109 RepID=A0A841FG24_9ACTN|nr:excinuclease ABC subunit UvrA [Phytomonospora endophytica]MBB6034555.1 excinuclease UvrABC ATPase subunit [Phytomonospora endophytica]GIG70464.1 thiamine ABC transporter permease [Phytomonospora endophytica]
MTATQGSPASSGHADIRITGARVHNLKDVSLVVPANKITVFTGVSGSGKSSIVFDTIAVEAQRQLYGTFSWFIRNQLPKYERPHADTIENLTTPIIVDQKPVGGNARSTVGTMTDIYGMIRGLFAKCGDPVTNNVGMYGFNDPQGMCPECDGIGRTIRPDLDLMLDRSKSLDEGAILLPGYKVGGLEWQAYGNYEGLDPAKRLSDYREEEWNTLLHGSTGKVELRMKNGNFKANYEGVYAKFVRQGVKRDLSGLSERTRENIQKFLTEGVCPACDGARLNPQALATTIGGRNIAEWSRMQITDLIEVLAAIAGPPEAAGPAGPIAEGARVQLQRVADIGLGYLSLDRATSTLSGGEGQRLKMVKHLGSSLTAVTYIFDEPSTGLHPRDVGRLNDLLRALRDKGNTVLVVEHDPDVIVIADHVVDVGPAAGAHGGRIVFEGPVAALKEADTLTGRGLSRAGAVKAEVRRPTGKLSVDNADLHNLKNVSVAIPTGVLTAVTGVAGSGKSSLISEVFMAAYPETIFVDQSAIGASSRSTPASYLGIMDPLRKAFAAASGAAPGLFSFNSTGACEQCQGKGVIITELAYMDPITTHCDGCDGRRFKESVLEHRLRGKSIADVLELSAEDAVGFLTEKPMLTKARTLVDVGLSYLSLGQPLSTLSGGERQRIKLATQLHRTGGVYVLDEPTTGLHMSDVDTLLALMNGMVDKGNTVVVIEHNLDVIQQADWVVDLGPDGGKDGGEVVFTGTPAALLESTVSLTGEYLRRYHAA